MEVAFNPYYAHYTEFSPFFLVIMPSLPIDIGSVPACVHQAAADYAVPVRALLAIKVVAGSGGNVPRGLAGDSPYPLGRSWLQALAKAWGADPTKLARDVCWTARATAYVLRYEVNQAGGNFWAGVAHFTTSVPPGEPDRLAEVAALIEDAAHRNQIDPYLVRAVVQVESNFKKEARSPKGAIGLMQLMPATAARYGVTEERDLYLPPVNISAGTQYLRDLSVMFQGDVFLTLAAYNAGEGAVLKHGMRVPPYAETQSYVQAVSVLYGPTFKAMVYQASLQF